MVGALTSGGGEFARAALGGSPLGATAAIEGLGVLLYLGLVLFVMRMASRWADRSLEADPAAKTPSADRSRVPSRHVEPRVPDGRDA